MVVVDEIPISMLNLVSIVLESENQANFIEAELLRAVLCSSRVGPKFNECQIANAHLKA